MNKKQADKTILYATLALAVFGLMMIFSAGVIYANTRFGDPNFFFKRQLIGVSIGLLAMYLTQRLDYNFWKKISFPFFIL